MRLNWKANLIAGTFFFLFPFYLVGQELGIILGDLSKKYGFTYQEIKADTFFKEKFLVDIVQPVDHDKPDGDTFKQRVFISHKGFDRPVVFVTEGYAAGYAAFAGYREELDGYLEANNICVEHRYFGESVPVPLDWTYLNIRQAAADHHRIISIFREIYNAGWVSTGISKGGQTAMFHRSFYPGDVDATVSYVSPLNFSIEDKRAYRFLKQAGDSTRRAKIREYQLEMLTHRDRYLPEFIKLAEDKKLTYPMGYEKAFDLMTFEYEFASWQWGYSSNGAADKESPEKMIQHMDHVAGINWISDQGIEEMRPFFYQALTELGFYGYDISAFQGLTLFERNPVFDFTAPDGVRPVYDPAPMQKVDHFVRHEAENMIFIYGETDAWSSTAVDLTYNSNCLKIVNPGGSHLTRIGNLPEQDRKQVIETLKEWLREDKKK